VFRAFGRVGVLVHAHFKGRPKASADVAKGITELRALGAEQLLIFTNAEDHKVIGSYRAVAGELYSIPQGLGSLSYNLLTSTLVYLDHRSRIRWKLVQYRY
jgi:hypothetical protein